MKTIQPNTTAPRTRKTARILAGSIAALLAVQSASATSIVWDGDSLVDGNWSTLLNWVGDAAAPGATSGTTNADIAVFNSAIANTWGNAAGNPIVTTASLNLGGINFNTAAGNYFIGSPAAVPCS